MVVKLYLSRTSGNTLIKVRQEHIKRIFDCKNIEYEEIDVADPRQAPAREFMVSSLRRNDPSADVLPPHLFKDDNYRGDYSGFFEAVETETMYRYLGLDAPKTEVEYQRLIEQKQQQQQQQQS